MSDPVLPVEVALPPRTRAAMRAHIEAELRRTRRSSARRRLAAVVGVTLAAVLLPAAGVAAYLLTRADPPGTGTWTWDGAVPGQRVDDETVANVARFQRMSARLPTRRGVVDPESVREVVRLETDNRVHTVHAARGEDGRICFAGGSEGFFGGFTCLPPDEHFPRVHALLPAADALAAQADPVLIQFRSEGGPEPRTVGWATIVGVARSDVTRIVATMPDGSKHELPLNEWRGFAYSSEPRRFPIALTAYGERRKLFGTDEYVIEYVALGGTRLARPSPLCGGEAGPCDPELDRISRAVRAKKR